MYGVKVHWAVKGVAGDKAGETQTRVTGKLRENHEIDINMIGSSKGLIEKNSREQHQKGSKCMFKRN